MAIITNALTYFTITDGGSGYPLDQAIPVFVNGVHYAMAYASGVNGHLLSSVSFTPGSGLKDGVYKFNGYPGIGEIVVSNGSVTSVVINNGVHTHRMPLLTSNIEFDYDTWPEGSLTHSRPTFTPVLGGMIDKVVSLWETLGGDPTAYPSGSVTVTMGTTSGSGCFLVPVFVTYDSVTGNHGTGTYIVPSTHAADSIELENIRESVDNLNASLSSILFNYAETVSTELDVHNGTFNDIKGFINTITNLGQDVEQGFCVYDTRYDIDELGRATLINALREGSRLQAVSDEMENPTPMPLP